MFDDQAEAEPDGDKLLRRGWRIALVLLGILVFAGGIYFGLYNMLVLGTSYAHDSTPTAEFKAAGNAKMWLALMLVVFGIACLACRRSKHVILVSVLGIALITSAGIAAWHDELSERAERASQGYAIQVEPYAPPPTTVISNEQAR